MVLPCCRGDYSLHIQCRISYLIGIEFSKSSFWNGFRNVDCW